MPTASNSVFDKDVKVFDDGRSDTPKIIVTTDRNIVATVQESNGEIHLDIRLSPRLQSLIGVRDPVAEALENI